MKVMLLVSGDLWAGAEAVVYQLGKGLKTQEDIEVMVVCLNHGRLSELLANTGVHIVVIDEAFHGFWGIARKLFIVARTFSPDIIHAHRYKENILAMLISTFCHFPQLVTTIHGISEVKRNLARKIVASIERIMLKHGYARVIAVSEDLVLYLVQKNRISPEKVVRIYNGSEMLPAHKTNRIRKTIRIGSAGRLVPVKDFELMVEVARNLCAERENVKFILAGDGPERDALRRRVKSYGIRSYFTLLGHVDDMEGFYSEIDIYLNTSRQEGLPITIIEAMSRCLPIVAPDVGGIKEIVIDKETGRLIRGRDPREFTQALKCLIDSPSLIDSMGTKARERAEEVFSNTSMVRAYSSLYRQVLGRKGKV
jgi:glycosyltransferase involved in cell wall biosynthesis